MSSEEKASPVRYKKWLKEEQIVIEGDNGVEEHYTLREMVGSLRGRWLVYAANRTQVNQATGQVIGVKKDTESYQSYLIHLSLFDRDGKHVSEETINGWGGSIIQDLFDRAQVISALVKLEDDGKAKK
jgi:hypothetical protein